MANIRFTAQVLGTVDGKDFATVQQEIFKALGAVPGFKITTCNLSGWMNSEGKLRQFDDNGIEIASQVVVNAAPANAKEAQVEEVVV